MSTRLRNERGITLPIALLVMLVLSISVLATVHYTGANARNASLSKERQNAKGLAEDGFNRAAAILYQLVEDAGETPWTAELGAGSVPSADMPAGHGVSWEQLWKTGTGLETQWRVRATATVPNPSGPDAAPITRAVEATLYLSVETTATTIPWKGVFAAEQGDRPLLSDDNAIIDTPLYVKEGYSSYSSTGVGTGPIPIVISGGKIMTSDFRVYGRLAVTGSADVASIGASARPGISWKSSFPPPLVRSEFRVDAFRVKDGCSTSTSGPWGTAASKAVCATTSASGGPTQRFWLPCPGGACSGANVVSPAYSDSVPNIPKPTVDFPARYAEAAPGSTARNHRCYAASQANLNKLNDKIGSNWSTSFAGAGWAGASNRIDNDTTRGSGEGSLGNVNLMPDVAYDCRLMKADGTQLGRIAWQPSSNPNLPGTLTVDGDFYFDGNILLGDGTNSTSPHGWGEIVGTARIWITGRMELKGTHAGLCGVADTAANRAAHSVPGSPSARGRCLNGKKGDTVPPTQPPIDAPEIWDPGTTEDIIYFNAAYSPHQSTIMVDNDFQLQSSLYAGCTRNALSGTDSLCPTLNTPPRSGLIVKNNATVKGPVVVDSVEVLNNGVIAGWTPLTDLSETGTEGQTVQLTILPGSWKS